MVPQKKQISLRSDWKIASPLYTIANRAHYEITQVTSYPELQVLGALDLLVDNCIKEKQQLLQHRGLNWRPASRSRLHTSSVNHEAGSQQTHSRV